MMRLVAAAALLGVLGLSLGAGNRAYQAGRFEDAVAEYRRALAGGDESPVLRYNLGTALLRLGRHAEAREELEHAARSGDPRARQPAHYNAGNTDLEPSFVAAPTPERTAALRRAIVHYRQALLLDAGDLDAKWNLELAQRLLAEQAGGGGEDDDDPQQGGGGAGGEGADSPAQPDATPSPADGAGAQPQMTPTEAEQVLRQAAEREQELQQQKLRRTTSPPPNVRDW